MKFKWEVLALVLILAFFAAACGGAPATESSAVSVDEPSAEVNADTSGEEPAGEAPDSVETEEEMAANTDSEEAESVDDEEAGEIPVTGEEIEHLVSPASFVLASLQRVVDCNTGPRALNNTDPMVAAECDAWDRNRYERPMDETGWGYLPEVDIVQVELGQDDEWIYSQIELFMIGDDAPDLHGSYALEIDLNLDSRGDLLVLVDNPASGEPGEWNAAGVQVWQDANDDVGSETAVLPDGSNTGDGYEVQLFDAGRGEDPDLAWARVHPGEGNIVELSFKKSLLRGKTVFAWWAWASAEPLDPASFDYDDTFSEDGFSSMDNTCAWMFGQAPMELANICPTINIPQPESPEKKSGGGGEETCSPPPGGCTGPGEIWIQEECKCVVYN